MDMKTSMVAVALGVSLFMVVLEETRGQTLHENILARVSVCHDTILLGSCFHGHVVAVKDVELGTKLETTCGLSVTNASCCEFKHTDCLIPYTGTAQQLACSGRNMCSSIAVPQTSTRDGCGENLYPDQSHYLTMEYYCIPETRIAQMCDVVSETVKGVPAYIQNYNYPDPIRQIDRMCTCSARTSVSTSKIRVFFVHVQLADGYGVCAGKQSLTISDNGRNFTWTCADNTYYAITEVMESQSDYISVTLENPEGRDDGYVWLGFEATDGTTLLHIDCPAIVETTASGEDHSTTSTSSTIDPISTTSIASPYSGYFGEIIIILGVIAGGLFLLALILGLALVFFILRWKKKKNPPKKTEQTQNGSRSEMESNNGETKQRQNLEPEIPAARNLEIPNRHFEEYLSPSPPPITTSAIKLHPASHYRPPGGRVHPTSAGIEQSMGPIKMSDAKKVTIPQPPIDTANSPTFKDEEFSKKPSKDQQLKKRSSKRHRKSKSRDYFKDILVKGISDEDDESIIRDIEYTTESTVVPVEFEAEDDFN